MAHAKPAPKLPYPVLLIVGVILMFAGFYVSKNIEIPFLVQLAEKGIVIDIGKTIAVLGVLLIVFPAINTFYLTPLKTAIDERNHSLESTFAEAESLRAEMTKMRADYESQITKTEQDARERIQAQVREAQEVRTRMMAEAGALREQMVQQAHDEINREKEKVMNEVRLQVVSLTMGATEKLLGENVDDPRNRRLVEEFIAQAEVPRG